MSKAAPELPITKQAGRRAEPPANPQPLRQPAPIGFFTEWQMESASAHQVQGA